MKLPSRLRKLPRPSHGQSGVVLLEALIAILIFSLGILAVIGLQAQSIRNSAEAKFRADASYLANQLIGRMWADRANIASYAFRPTGTNCSFSGTTTAYAERDAWVTSVTRTLPGATTANQQIIVGANNLITVTICWVSNTGQHNYSVTTQING
jgi:type IV pilus assembly protein PilV